MTKRKVLFAFEGTFDKEPCELEIHEPIAAGRDFSCRIRLTRPVRIDQEIFGASAKQARELVFALCHGLLDRGALRDERGKRVKLPGKPLPKPRKPRTRARKKSRKKKR